MSALDKHKRTVTNRDARTHVRSGVGGPGPFGRNIQWYQNLEKSTYSWFKTTAYPHYIKLFWAIVRTEPAHRDPATIAASAKAFGDSLKILDAHLATHPYVAGEGLTMGDIPFGPAAYRYFNLDIERPELPSVSAWYRRLCDRAAYREHVMIPFGRNPAEWYTIERAGPA